MSWRDSLKGLFYEDDGKQPVDKPPATTGGKPVPPPLKVIPTTSRAAGMGNVDPEFVQALQETVEQGTPPILITFEQLLEGLKAVIPDETARYKAAITSLTATGKGTPEQLKSALAERLRALDRAKSLFLTGLDNKVAQEIKTKQGQVEQLKQQAITLQSQLTELQSQQASLQSEIDTAQGEINAKQAKFDAAYGAVETALKSDGDKIAAFLS